MIKLLIASEIHLGFSRSHFPTDNDSQLKTFKKILKLANEHDILIFAGTFFNNINSDSALYSEILKELRKEENSSYNIIITELFDITKSSDKTTEDLLSNENIIKNISLTEPYRFSYGEQNLDIYCLSKQSDLEDHHIADDKDSFTVGVFHKDFQISYDNNLDKKSNQDIKINNIDRSELKLDFFIPAKKHSFKIYREKEKIVGVSPGTPEPTSLDETGDRYVISLHLENNEIKTIKRLTVNSTSILRFDFDCEKSDSNDLIQLIDQNRSDSTIMAIKLQGTRDFPLPSEYIEKAKSEYKTILLDDFSTPTLNARINTFIKENSLRGDFYRILKDMVDNNLYNGTIPLEVMPDILSKLNSESEINIENLEDWLCTLSNA